ncbi:MAG: alpha/beta fold hydrolase [Candidatus Metalachnospira sp.]|nr:alpha/beta fold hydrolase [Candidatus Metalachnospira sp.]
MDITRYELNYSASNGRHDIFSCIWCDTTRKHYSAVVQLVHGMAEYILRYEDFAVYLAKRGYVVCGNDHSGHGFSAEKDNDFGYFGKKENSWKYLIDDMNYLEGMMRLKYPDIPYFMIGHGMGSLLAREYIAAYGDDFNGAVFMGTSGPKAAVDFGIRLSGMLASRHPMEQGVIINKLAFGDNNKKIKNARTEYDWLSTDKEMVEKYVNDEKCGFLFTFEGYHALFQLLKTVNRREWAESLPKNLPMLLISGKDDPVGGYGKGIKQVYNSMIKAGCTDTSIKLLYGARHEILNETRRDKVFGILYNWLENNID